MANETKTPADVARIIGAACRQAGSPQFLTVGIGGTEAEPVIYVYWKRKPDAQTAALKECGGYRIEHRVMGQPRALPARR